MSAYSIGQTKWSQSSDENDPALEITIPVVLPAGVRSKELTVLVKDDEVLCIKYKDSVLVQWRLFGKVSGDLEWRAESADSIVVDLLKKDPTSWPALVNIPMRADDKLLATESELDAYIAREVKPLPPPAKKQSESKTAEGESAAAAGGVDEEDLDKLLEDAVEEVHGSAEEEPLDAMSRAELRGMDDEENEIRAKLLEVQQKVTAENADETDEEVINAEKLLIQIEKMLTVHMETREMRSRASTLSNFLKTVEMDIRKGRLNVGEIGETETEAFDNDEERDMSPHQLLTTGIQLLQNQDPHALHFLRLAAIHHNHSTSVTVLFRIYSELGSPIGAYFLLRRAMDDNDVDVGTNLQVAEMFDRGVRHFPPVFGVAMHFYQRAAKAGSVQAMMGLAQLYLRGSTSASLLTAEERAKNIDQAKFHAWIQQALNRGSATAYFVKGSMHLHGDHGTTKSYAMAKEYIDRAKLCESEVIRRAPKIQMLLDKLRIEEEDAAKGVSAEPSSPATPASPAPSAASPSSAAVPSASTSAAVPQSAAQRLAALEGKSAAPFAATVKTAPKKSAAHVASGARARAFWEGAAVVGIATFSIYTLAFPIRVRLLGTFYDLLQTLLETFHLGGGSSSSGLL